MAGSMALKGVVDDLKQDFKKTLPMKVALMRSHLRNSGAGIHSLKYLEGMAHNLSGSAGSYGFSKVSECASALEDACRQMKEGEIDFSGERLAGYIDDIEESIDRPATGLKISDLEAVSRTDLNAVHTENTGRRHKIILVDDNRDIAESVCAHLKLIDCDCIWLSDPGELKDMMQVRPDLVIMDIRFPDDENLGLSIIETLKRDDLIPCPVIFLSRKDDFETRLKAVQIGCSAYFMKPFSPVELLNAVQDAVCAQNQKPFHVLIVDDEPEFTKLAGRFLSIAGMTHDAVHDPTLALQAIEKTRPDVVLLDVNMPKCRGFDLAKVIRQDHRYTHIPILFLTSADSNEKKVEAERVFADGFHSKGGDPRHLVEAVKSRAIRARESSALYQRLRKSESHFRNVAENAGDAILSVDSRGRVILWSGGAKRIFGYSESEMLGEMMTDIIPHKMRQAHLEGFNKACLEDEYMPYCGTVNVKALHKDGTEFPIEMTLSRNGEGDGLYFTAIVRDVTARLQSEQALRESEQRFRDIAETASDWFWEMGPDFRFTFDSSNYEPRINMGIGSPIGRTRMGYAGIDLNKLDEVARQNWLDHQADLEAHRPFKDFEYEIVNSTGTRMVLRVNGIPFFDGDKKFMGYRGAVSDVTELKLAESQLKAKVEGATRELHEKSKRLEEALEKEKELNLLQRQFVSMASHEFRTPLSIIDGTAQRIQRSLDKKPKEYIEEKVEKIRKSVTRLTGLIESTLSADKLESGKTSFSRNDINISELLEGVCDGQRDILPDHAINVTCHDRNLVSFVDESLVEQVFTNLLSNAVKYSPNGGAVDVLISSEGAWIEIVFRDYGVGIPADELGNLFQRFYRSRTSAGIVGTGLGLYLVKQFIELHEGKISVQSEEGKGSTFIVRLPRVKNEDIPYKTETGDMYHGYHSMH